MRSSDLLLRLVSVAVAVGLFLVVRGERQVTLTFSVPVAPRLPPAVSAAGPLPADVSVRRFVPSAAAATICVEPPRVSSQAIMVPSGDQTGFSLAPPPSVIWKVLPLTRSSTQIALTVRARARSRVHEDLLRS